MARSEEFVFTSRKRFDTIVIKTPPDFDMCSASGLDQAIDNVVETDLDRRVVIDLQGCRYIDASGLAALVRARKRLNRRVTLVVPPGSHIRRLLEVAHMHDAVGVADTLVEAMHMTTAETRPVAHFTPSVSSGRLDIVRLAVHMRQVGEEFVSQTGGRFSLDIVLDAPSASGLVELACFCGTRQCTIIAKEGHVPSQATLFEVAAQIVRSLLFQAEVDRPRLPLHDIERSVAQKRVYPRLRRLF